MKKKYIFLLPLFPALFSLTSCGGPTECITYGYKYSSTETIGATVELTEYSQIESRMDATQNLASETFLLVDYSQTCSCKEEALNFMRQYSKAFNTNVYSICKTIIHDAVTKESKSNYGLDYTGSGSTLLYLVSNHSIKYSWLYSSSSAVWNDVNVMHNDIIKLVKDPNMNLCNISDKYLEDLTAEYEGKFILEYGRDTCPDCSYIDPNVIWKQAKAQKWSVPIYCYSVNGIYKDSTVYKTFKDEHLISNVNSIKYGYDTGYVPMLQYWNNGNIQDACVAFNDTISKVGETFKVTNSYFTEERKPNLHYLWAVETKVLKGLEVPENDITTWKDPKTQEVLGYSWKHNAAFAYYGPLVEAFITNYCI